ncbi:hypothetical protein ACFFX0_02870 [Citricoccus parietis]|uniref:Uncharacterized protein n=1 Tax=Citricoccus parietis TaxID=592307 RepID=A0ABV5FU32_9MICC
MPAPTTHRSPRSSSSGPLGGFVTVWIFTSVSLWGIRSPWRSGGAAVRGRPRGPGWRRVRAA